MPVKYKDFLVNDEDFTSHEHEVIIKITDQIDMVLGDRTRMRVIKHNWVGGRAWNFDIVGQINEKQAEHIALIYRLAGWPSVELKQSTPEYIHVTICEMKHMSAAQILQNI